jgi:uncharacterized protein (DUF433 family)
MFRSVAVGLVAGSVTLALEAGAERASCEELLAARASGRSDAEIQTDYQTTHARLSACERIADHRDRLQAQRDDVAAARAERAQSRDH